MLLINFFKKASGLIFCLFGRLLMLFLHQKVSIIALLFLFFFNASYNSFALTSNSSKEKIHQVKNEIAKNNKRFDDYLLFSVVLITGLVVFVGYKLRNLKRKEFHEYDKLLCKIIASKKRGIELNHHLSLVHTLHENLISRLSEIILRLKEFRLNISTKQEHLAYEVDEMIGYTESCISKFKQSVHQFNSLE